MHHAAVNLPHVEHHVANFANALAASILCRTATAPRQDTDRSRPFCWAENAHSDRLPPKLLAVAVRRTWCRLRAVLLSGVGAAARHTTLLPQDSTSTVYLVVVRSPAVASKGHSSSRPPASANTTASPSLQGLISHTTHRHTDTQDCVKALTVSFARLHGTAGALVGCCQVAGLYCCTVC